VTLIVLPLIGFKLSENEKSAAPERLNLESSQNLVQRIEDLTVYLKKNPRDGASLKRLGELYAKAGKLSEAVSAYVAAAEILPKDPEIRRAFIELQAMGHTTGNK
jgi:cytochrome c-type biogenesis protein CcmH/NrfG